MREEVSKSSQRLDALTAEKVFGWKSVDKHEGSLVAKRQDKAGRWRRAKVPNYSTLHASSTDKHIQQLGRLDRYDRESPRLLLQKYSLRVRFTEAPSGLSIKSTTC